MTNECICGSTYIYMCVETSGTYQVSSSIAFSFETGSLLCSYGCPVLDLAM